MSTAPSDKRLALFIYIACVSVFAATASTRLFKASNDIHFSYQAKMFLERRLDLGRQAPNSNDWAEVEYLTLKDGRTVAGAFLRATPTRFRKLDGKMEYIEAKDIQSRFKKYYVSFPPFPALLFIPGVLIWGLAFNDVIFSVLLAGIGPALLFLILRRLSKRGDSDRTVVDDLWLTTMFSVGSVFYFSAVQGTVWYTAHMVATALSGAFLLASFDVAHPLLAGLALGAIVLTRPPIGALGIFFLYELWRAHKATAKPWLRPFLACAIPVAAMAALGFAFNYARFGSFGEFGHSYLNVRWTERIQRYGLENFSFLSRNLSAMLTLTPKFVADPPYLKIGWHGLSLLITTPALGYLLWPRIKSPLHRALWLAVLPTALLSLLYQNDGWVQFGYRFSLDYMIALTMLLSIGGRPITRTWKILILVGIAVNLFGAITFNRMWMFYQDTFFPISPSDY